MNKQFCKKNGYQVTAQKAYKVVNEMTIPIYKHELECN